MFAFNRITQSPELLQCYHCLLFVWRNTVPMEVALKCFHSLTWYSMSDDHHWLFKYIFCLFKSSIEITKIMPPNFDHMPIKCSPFVCKWFQWHYIFSKTIYLYIISINYRYQVSQFLSTCEHYRLPSITFIMFTIRHQTIYIFI